MHFQHGNGTLKTRTYGEGQDNGSKTVDTTIAHGLETPELPTVKQGRLRVPGLEMEVQGCMPMGKFRERGSR